MGAFTGDGVDDLTGLGVAQILAQFRYQVREVVTAAGAAEGAHGGHVRTGCAAKAEVDTVGIHRCQCAELLRDD